MHRPHTDEVSPSPQDRWLHARQHPNGVFGDDLAMAILAVSALLETTEAAPGVPLYAHPHQEFAAVIESFDGSVSQVRLRNARRRPRRAQMLTPNRSLRNTIRRHLSESKISTKGRLWRMTCSSMRCRQRYGHRFGQTSPAIRIGTRPPARSRPSGSMDHGQR